MRSPPERSEEYTIRQARQDEIGGIMRINMCCLPENYPSYFFLMHYHNWPRGFLVSEMGNDIVGYIMCRVEKGISNFGSEWATKGHIISIAVMPHARRRGMGTSLMSEAMKALKEEYGAEEYYLEVRVSNIPAISLYKKLGYEIIKVLKGYYINGEDAYLMARKA